jgi:cytochrome c6
VLAVCVGFNRSVRTLALLLAALCLLMAGCGGGDDETSATQPTEPETTAATTTGGGDDGDGAREGNAQNGELVFVNNGCGFCHTLKDVAADGNVGPNLDETKPSYDLVVERVTNGKAPMPSFSDDMTPQEIQDVAAYVTSVAGK